MRVLVLLIAVLMLLSCRTQPTQTAPPERTNWRDLLNRPVDDEWQQVCGTALFQRATRPAETVAEKVSAIQMLIAKSNKDEITIPVFLPPAIALIRWEATPATTSETRRLGVPMMNVPAIEVFRYIGSLFDCDVVETKDGIILKPRHDNERESTE